MKLYFDIGANIGDYTNSLMEKNEYDKIICVEANPNIIQKLKNRFFENNKIEIINKAVSSEKGFVDFYVCESCDVVSTCDIEWINQSRFSDNKTWSKFEIETISIDDLVNKYGIPEHIKIDVEGYELNVIKGMTKNYGSQIKFEWAEEKLNDIFEIIDYLSLIGYSKFSYILQDKYDEEPFEYFSKKEFEEKFKNMCVPSRQDLWGMIFVKNN